MNSGVVGVNRDCRVNNVVAIQLTYLVFHHLH